MTVLVLYISVLFCLFASLASYKLCYINANKSNRKSPFSRLSFSMNSSPEEQRTFASYVVYKGRAALAIKTIGPTFTQLSPSSRVVSKRGGLLLEFALISGPREYDWSKKGNFLLDVTECGEVLNMDLSSKASIEFIHDPNMGGEKAGQINKKLKLAPTPDGKGVFFSLQVSDKSSGPASYSLPVSFAEVAVIRNVISHCIPRFLGFDQPWGALVSGETLPLPPPPPSYVDLDDN